MSNFSRINDDFFVSAQIDAADIEAASKAGFGSILNLRPDEEKPDHLGDEEVCRLSGERGLDYQHVPVPIKGAAPDITPERLRAFAQALSDLQDPVLAYCGTGRRAVLMWALCAAGKTEVDEILSCCAAAGHDLSPLKSELERRAQPASAD